MASGPSDILRRAQALIQSGRPGEAVDVLLAAERAAPLGPDAQRMLVQALSQSGDLHTAMDRQLSLVPQDVAASDAQGRADALAAAQLAQLAMNYEQSAGIARQLVARDPLDLDAAGLLATLELWLDGPERAQDVLAAVVDRPDAPPHLLAEALAYASEPSPRLVERIEPESQNTGLPAQARADLLLALAQYHDRQGEAEQAWELAEQGNALAPARQQQDWNGVLAIHRQLYRAMEPVGEVDGPRHVYLIGTPRSGQSLLQSMLAASPDVGSLGERGALLQHVLFRSGLIAQMPSGQRADYYRQLHESDRRGIARQVGEPAIVVDKSPLHLPVAGSIARIHPGAVFGAVLRDPADTALSIWLRSMPPVYDYANSLDAIFAHLDFALDALAAWREEGIDVRLMEHAELIEEPAQFGEALAAWLDIDWSPEFLDPQRRTAPVATFSAAQVRQPISPKVARGAAPYAERLEPWAEQIETLSEKTAELLGG
ncbi:tetratricopeptide repeat-containing sulfotransferase family protein [Erythrobacter litoralis]|uniref:TPR/sulfotransferase domain protein n=1 Tax=Erythrobacter litoralis (strain HTCC2594) TaxID=314225 RepID=Q2N7N2_ERYLH|nr:sulfotransferase [Erythrobacter litoralis]ABC64309.1 TPR/sulfotransferase domain protein [Erythrobacter litoralis HTCC2594]